MTGRTLYRRESNRMVIPDWTKLVPGDYVTVMDAHALPHAGWVDDVTEDGAVAWLLQANGRGRRMFFYADGCMITVDR